MLSLTAVFILFLVAFLVAFLVGFFVGYKIEGGRWPNGKQTNRRRN